MLGGKGENDSRLQRNDAGRDEGKQNGGYSALEQTKTRPIHGFLVEMIIPFFGGLLPPPL